MGDNQMEDNAFELLSKMYAEMTGRFDKIEIEVLKTNMKIENDIMPKLEVLFDGYEQNTEQLSRLDIEVTKHTEQLSRIETEVTKHEEVILRRIK
jgi:hypothetical protein